MNVMDQDQNHRQKRGKKNKRNRPRRYQQQAQRERTAVDVEMSERMHEILQEEGRTRHEYEQRQLRIVETEGAPEQFYEQPERDEPDDAGKREHQPHRNFREQQPHQRADQRALGEAEMIVDQKMDVGDVGRQRDLVDKHPDNNGDI